MRKIFSQPLHAIWTSGRWQERLWLSPARLSGRASPLILVRVKPRLIYWILLSKSVHFSCTNDLWVKMGCIFKCLLCLSYWVSFWHGNSMVSFYLTGYQIVQLAPPVTQKSPDSANSEWSHLDFIGMESQDGKSLLMLRPKGQGWKNRTQHTCKRAAIPACVSTDVSPALVRNHPQIQNCVMCFSMCKLSLR